MRLRAVRDRTRRCAAPCRCRCVPSDCRKDALLQQHGSMISHSLATDGGEHLDTILETIQAALARRDATTPEVPDFVRTLLLLGFLLGFFGSLFGSLFRNSEEIFVRRDVRKLLLDQKNTVGNTGQ